jgi:ribonuclease-3 family protein
LLPLFDEVEADVFRRARNCHIQTSAKHADRSEYRRASGFEAVLGYLYITGNNERLFNFLEKCFEENK